MKQKQFYPYPAGSVCRKFPKGWTSRLKSNDGSRKRTMKALYLKFHIRGKRSDLNAPFIHIFKYDSVVSSGRTVPSKDESLSGISRRGKYGKKENQSSGSLEQFSFID